ncbi:MAG: hypothetical protein R2788_21090 [Saprospiraceae bacterium]
MSSGFPNNTSWRFIDKSLYSDPLNSAFPEIYNINTFQGNMSNVDFIAVKIGDVEQARLLPNMLHVLVDDRNGGLLTLTAYRWAIGTGERVPH